jgi:hypothetical protein
MNRRRRLPLKKRSVSSNGSRLSNLAGLLSQIATPGVALTVCGAVIVSLALFCLLSWRKARSAASGRPQVASATATPAQAEKEIRTGETPLNQDGVQRTAANDDVSPSATPVSSPVPDATAIVSASQSREVKRSEAERKNVERERREAERKRSRLESMYRKHQISDEAYRKGQDEYKSEMAKYRSTFNGTGAANE